MTEEQIEKLAAYAVFLRGRVTAYQSEGEDELVDYCVAKLEAVREISIVFNCREEFFKKIEQLEAGR